MAEGYTQRFELNKSVYDESQSRFITVESSDLQLNNQDNIESFVYSQGELKFYDAYNQIIDTYYIDDIYNHNGTALALDVVHWNGSDLQDMENYNATGGGIFTAFYGGDPETGGNNTPSDPEPVITITLSPPSLSLSVGGTGGILVSTNSQQGITWSSNNPAIATVNSSGVSSGLVTAISVGTAIITASVGDKTASCMVTVSAPVVSNYTLDIYNGANTDIMESVDIPKGELINKYLYENGVYTEINDRDGYYISEWKNRNTGSIIQDTQTMEGDLEIYPIYTELPTEYYSIVYLPNLTQRFPFGAGSSYSLGDKGGEETHKLTISEMPSHNHNLNYIDSNGSSEKKYYAYDQELDPAVNVGRIDTAVSDDQYMTGVSGVKNVYGAFVGNIVTSTGAGGSHNNMPPYLTVNFIIKYK